MKTVLLFGEGLLTKLELGMAIREGLQEITEKNLGKLKEIVSEEERFNQIKEKFTVSEEEELLRLAEKAMMTPVETLEKNGKFAGYRYAVNESIGQYTYTDIHVRLSDEEHDTELFGSIWFKNGEGEIQQPINFEYNGSRINYYRRNGSIYRLGRYFSAVNEMVMKRINAFKEQVDEKVEKSNSKLEQAIAQAKGE